MPKIKHAQLDWNDSGTPISEQFDDVYFSNNDGLAETRYVFLTQNHIPQRWQEHQQSRFVIAETGFGTGLNFLAVCEEFEQFREKNPQAALTQLHFISFEKFPVTLDDLKQAHAAWPELEKYAVELQQKYPMALPGCQRLILADGAITLDLWLGDIKETLPVVPTYSDGLVDAWFLDGFAPSKNPEMWNQDLFNGMAKLAKQDGTVATFTAAGFVRRGLIEAGFDMKKVKGFAHKREMIAGVMRDKQAYSNISPLFDRKPLIKNSTTDSNDIAIIGGGIASACLAYSLIQKGMQVTLYCKDKELANGASGNKQGAVYPLLNGEHNTVSQVFANGFIYARKFYEQLAQKTPFDHQWCGVTQLFWNEDERKKLSKIVQGQFPNELVTAQDAQQTQASSGLDCSYESLFYPQGGWLSPLQCTQGVIELLCASSKLTLKLECEVTELEQVQNQDNWQVTTSKGTHTHSAVVIANGHSFDQFIQAERIPLGKVKGQVSHIPTTENLQKLKTVLCYDGYLTPKSPLDHHCIGASYDSRNINTEYDEQAQQQNAQKLQQCLPQQPWPSDVDISDNDSRQGIRSVSRDHLPFAGNVGKFSEILEQYANLADRYPRNKPEPSKVSQYSNLFCLVGMGSRGLTSAPLVAEILASQMLGYPIPMATDILEALHPSRMWVRKLRKGRPIAKG
ncbi:bifunctional tRNA (5-methylaminomethyl-2-thiouridylate)-methyltransferase MnmD/FAD-dependent cmnm(5)s(2)U34 oxidoreductase MnmC [Vibrio sp. UCD-FRSSP16_10]|uniref:bifunctional tRNA (5-methylaminomethyl-2-thiouridine)(34)-methyltransferase MnmD/FAD-dependent 5-carboxymethylaminomethyl-2-thiouridine(34) oxidoreductase MnmC n=1 Tax=unclassified Vibrio TaxID=2614977 RepID=UPI0007FE7C21|nr:MULTISPECIES: bifunctional tRNA (5-methylaminomethyl-2-thiouridine)(34)-methyltransferase MnmD/FAD-dependent 5-carboxymethylaminomethyl-2-thiouridine(34) oxidoreductase MnmC [unclassified Vibrio]OBT15881.1 bifunctional tRNA (5-methylaminomethyl-2-thiouridylate)-methyltransferase MnmD/FAD-dependent cmnm(5)s(2)U34 oxidoreductase MnmC [Vibrio sp. UCD-FRSSP16_10]OBT17775.1 bifunctional tRNA (5-methylaminomethyl-2-thiouridylate)-methyltransferase MnmD/FAD-dependent cmnm(5)s(2)U34 oxidoreductase Mnm